MKIKLLLAALLLVFTPQAKAQLSIGGTVPVYDSRTNTYLLTVPESVFGSAYQAPVVIDNGVTAVQINGQDVNGEITFPLVAADTSYTFSFKQNNKLTQSSIHFTYLPIMCITGTFNDTYKEAPLQITMPDGKGVQQYRTRIKRAGSSTNLNWIYKRNFHVKFIDENGEKMDVSFFGLRNDNHWRLDAGTRDMIRFRNYAAHGLWADFGTKSYYADKQPNARSYIRGSHVEVFMNGAYHGFYNFTEYLDRKQMKLKKYDEVEIPGEDGGESQTAFNLHGLMWKAKESGIESLFKSAARPFDNTEASWGNFELEYPEIEDVGMTDYSVLRDAVRFVAQSSNIIFTNHVDEYFDLPVLADYYLFLHVMQAIDNASNNLVLACYDSAVDKKLTFAVWDLDATVGQHYLDIEGYYHADSIQPEIALEDVPERWNGFPKSNLFKRIKTVPSFYRMVINRYWQLRETILQPDSLVARYRAIYDRLDNCGALDRESARWSGTDEINYRTLDFEGEWEYLSDWLRRRIAFLDTHTFACLRGDADDNGELTIDDLTAIINYLLSGKLNDDFNQVNADVDANNIINIEDVTSLISILLSL